MREGQTRTGNPYGVVKMEDYDGSGEFPLFGKSWLEIRNYFVEGTSLFIRAKMVPRSYNNSILDLQVLSVELMNDIKESAIQKITIDIPLDKITDTIVEDLSQVMAEENGNTELWFNIRGVNNLHVNLVSKKFKIKVGKRIMDFLADYADVMEYRIN